MKKKSAGKMFLKGFFTSSIIIILLLGAGILSYQAVMHYMKPDNTAVAYKNLKDTDTVSKADIDGISRNLIFSYSKKSGKIDKVVLEILDCKKKELSYITIPLRTQFTMSGSLYKKMVVANPAIPQVIKLSGISKYLDRKTEFDYGTLMVENLLGTSISYYTAIPKSIYDKIFSSAVVTPGNSEAEGNLAEHAASKEIFTNEFKQSVSKLQSKHAISTYIEKLYPSVVSNLSLADKKYFIDIYSGISLEQVSFDLISGDNCNRAFIVDAEQAGQQLE